MPNAELLLDTHVFVSFVLGLRIDARARRRIERAAADACLAMPAICLWESTMLAHSGRLALQPSPAVFLRTAIEATGIQVIPLDAELAIAAGNEVALHGDPADRIVFATARVRGATLVTADARLLAHARALGVAALQPW